MSGPRSANSPAFTAALLGPRRPSEAAARGIPFGPLARLSLDAYLSARSAPDRVVLCPPGHTVAADLAFLQTAKRRLLWPKPPPDILQAIAGLVTNLADVDAASSPAGRTREASRARARGPLHAALLLEGLVTRERADAALASPVRLWIVESPRCVLLGEGDLADLVRRGVRWAALRPIALGGLAVSEALARARPRWPHGLRNSPAWRVPATERPAAPARFRKPSLR